MLHVPIIFSDVHQSSCIMEQIWSVPSQLSWSWKIPLRRRSTSQYHRRGPKFWQIPSTSIFPLVAGEMTFQAWEVGVGAGAGSGWPKWARSQGGGAEKCRQGRGRGKGQLCHFRNFLSLVCTLTAKTDSNPHGNGISRNFWRFEWHL